MVRWISLISLVCLFGLLGCQSRQSQVAPLVQPVAPAVVLSPILLSFTSEHCGPCIQQKPFVDWLETKIEVRRYDINRDRIARQYGIVAVPTYILGNLRTHDIREVIRALGLEEDFAKAFANAITSSTTTSCSRWAAERRIMGGDFPGPYSWKYHPWVKELHDTRATFNYVMKGAQLGITEVAINRALYILDCLKRDVLYVLPTTKSASKFSKGRFTTALGFSPYIKSLFTDLNSIDLKQAGQSTLYISGSRGNSNLKNIPVSELILDELDEMDQHSIRLALERLSGQVRKCVWGISTPTVPEFGVHKLYKSSTQEHFTFICPHCAKWTELTWPECFSLAGEHSTDVRCNESFLKCRECQHRLDHITKPQWLRDGKWVSMAGNSNIDFRGFYINQLYSYTITPGELASVYLAGKGDEWAATEFWNSKLGLPYIGEGAQVTIQMINEAVGDHSIGDLRPERGGERLITLGCDQGNTCHYVICEWLIDGDFSKDPSAATLCKVLDIGTFPRERLDELDRLMSEWQVLQAGVDPDPEVNEARAFARRFFGFVSLCRYRGGVAGKEVAESEQDTGAPMLTVDRTGWLSASLGRFKTNPPRIVLPRDYPRAFAEHIQNLVRRYKKDEKLGQIATYIDIGADHWGHALALAEIAMHRAPMNFDNRIGKVL